MRKTRPVPPSVASALATARFEVLPTAKVESALVDHVPRHTTITVTASPSKGLGATLDLTERLVGHGYRVVPHLAARMVSGPAELKEIVDRLVELGVDNVFCPAGDADPPAGEYTRALDLLRDLSELGRPFAQVGITGYPESHPTIADDLTIQAMWDKRAHATYIVSNLCFDPRAVALWVRRMRARGVDLPVLVGLPGPVERTKLVTMAARIGVGDSARFLRTHLGAFTRIALPGGFDPRRFLVRSARLLSDPAAGVVGLHLFTFNQIAETQAWLDQLRNGSRAAAAG